VRSIQRTLVEGLHAILLSLEDAADSNVQDDFDILVLRTGDKGKLMESMRRSLLQDEDEYNEADKEELLYVTNLYQCAVWLINRWAKLERSKYELS
jgi:hypothetical protein